MRTAWLLLDVQRHPLIRIIFALLMVALAAPAGFAAPAESAAASGALAPSTQPSTRPVEQLQGGDRRKMRQLARQALQAAKAGKLEEAETALGAALVIDPFHSTNLYNMACIKALRGRPDAAIDYLERAASEG